MNQLSQLSRVAARNFHHIDQGAKNRRLVYNRTGRFSALAENRDRTVPFGTRHEVLRWS